MHPMITLLYYDRFDMQSVSLIRLVQSFSQIISPNLLRTAQLQLIVYNTLFFYTYLKNKKGEMQAHIQSLIRHIS